MRGRRLFYPAGFLSRRKPVKQVLKAVRRVRDDDLRLIVKGQVERNLGVLERAAARDPRVEVVLDDLPVSEHLTFPAKPKILLGESEAIRRVHERFQSRTRLGRS